MDLQKYDLDILICHQGLFGDLLFSKIITDTKFNVKKLNLFEFQPRLNNINILVNEYLQNHQQLLFFTSSQQIHIFLNKLFSIYNEYEFNQYNILNYIDTIINHFCLNIYTFPGQHSYNYFIKLLKLLFNKLLEKILLLQLNENLLKLINSKVKHCLKNIIDNNCIYKEEIGFDNLIPSLINYSYVKKVMIISGDYGRKDYKEILVSLGFDCVEHYIISSRIINESILKKLKSILTNSRINCILCGDVRSYNLIQDLFQANTLYKINDIKFFLPRKNISKNNKIKQIIFYNMNIEKTFNLLCQEIKKK